MVPIHNAQPTAIPLLSSTFPQRQGFWIERRLIVISPQHLAPGSACALHYSLAGGLQVTTSGILGGSLIRLTQGGNLAGDKLTRFPQFASYAVLSLPDSIDSRRLSKILKGQVALSVLDASGTLTYATGLQTFGVLDDLYFYPGKLGPVIQTLHSSSPGATDTSGPVELRLWAPTAHHVSLQLFEAAADATPSAVLPMHEHQGVWSAHGDQGWIGKYYLYAVQVYVPALDAVVTNHTTDPWSIDLALNGTKSRITDLGSSAAKPSGWDQAASPLLPNLADLSIYELHIRDFSIGDATVPEDHRGTYAAFAHSDSDGMRHLRSLAASGLKAVHLLPSFDFSSVNEDKSTWKTAPDLSQYPACSDQQQVAVAAIQDSDGYNWGYDPVHYLAPEGSYAFNPEDRVREYRGMVQALHAIGLCVIQDVVFNHTSASGQDPKANLNLVVPGYYHRLDANGNLLNSSCCPDTASEHRMMEKLMIDTLVLNAREYKIDGFRFDLMGFHFIYNLLHIKEALAGLTPEKDDIDGSRIYLYGEGFNFGETASNQLGQNASQINLFGTGVGSFNDRIRDAIRGGGPFSDPRLQGFATGLFTASSAFTQSTTPLPDQLNSLLQYADQIRAGLAGNLRDFRFTGHTGTEVTGSQVAYGGEPTGYTASPVEAVNYCSVHDNHCLFDAVQLKSSLSESMEPRVRRHVLALTFIALAQGIPFFNAGDDLLRSKAMDGNSYNSGDWFNKIDWPGRTANWGIGLPIASENRKHWDIMRPLLSDPAYAPQPPQIALSSAAFREFLTIRYSSRLFRMTTLEEVQTNLSFLNTGLRQIPGLIVMRLDANSRSYGLYRHILVVFNATSAPAAFREPRLQGLSLRLHPVQQHSSDPVMQRSTFDPQSSGMVVPALTTAVFVSP